jgi:hypothetical protein
MIDSGMAEALREYPLLSVTPALPGTCVRGRCAPGESVASPFGAEQSLKDLSKCMKCEIASSPFRGRTPGPSAGSSQ